MEKQQIIPLDKDRELLIRIDERTKSMVDSLANKVSKQEHEALSRRVDDLFKDLESNQKNITRMGLSLIFVTILTGIINIYLKFN